MERNFQRHSLVLSLDAAQNYYRRILFRSTNGLHIFIFLFFCLCLRPAFARMGVLKVRVLSDVPLLLHSGSPRRCSLSSQAVTPGHSPLLTSTSILHLRDSRGVHLPSV